MSQQSQVVTGRAVLAAREAELLAKHGKEESGEAVPRPDWGGYILNIWDKLYLFLLHSPTKQSLGQNLQTRGSGAAGQTAYLYIFPKADKKK